LNGPIRAASADIREDIIMRLKLAVALIVAPVLGLLAAAGPADAAKAKVIRLSGCAQYQPPFCTILGGYSLLDAAPPVPTGVGVTVWGVKSGDLGVCFHPTLKVLRWSRNRMRCPL
jgi:hypothetical protein